MSVLKAPLQISGGGGLAVLTKTENIISQKITDYLTTNVLERVMNPSYGGNTSKLLFDNYDSLVFSEYRNEALNGLKQNVSGAQILDLKLVEIKNDTLSQYAENTVMVEVTFSLPAFGVRTAVVEIVNPDELGEGSIL